MFYDKLRENNEASSKLVKELFKASNRDIEKFCIVPFTNIILEPDGKVGVCRQQGSDFPIGNIKKNTILEIWNGPKAQKWREEFIKGKPKICSQNIHNDHCNLCPHTNKLWNDVDVNLIQRKPILKLTANLNGKCNLKCIMCHIWRKPNDIYNEANFWKPAKEFIFPYLKEVELLSGEPFIQDDTYKLIDEISLVNPECDWFITTNAHWRLSSKIKKYLDKIKINDFIISLDSVVPSTYSKIRIGGNLKIVKSTLLEIIEYNKSRSKNLGMFKLHFNFLIIKENWQEIRSILDYCSELQVEPFIDFCYRPNENSLLSLSEVERLEILIFFINNLTWNELLVTLRVINPLRKSLNHINQAYILIELQRKKNQITSNK